MELRAQQRLLADGIRQLAISCATAETEWRGSQLHAKAEDISVYLKRITDGHKIDKIGNGVDGIVFEHPSMSSVVVKLCPWKTGATSWARTCFKNGHGNRWLPAIHHVSQTKLSIYKKAVTFAVIFAEKLEEAGWSRVITDQIGSLYHDLENGKPGRYLNDHLESKPKDLQEAIKLVCSGYPKYRIDLHVNNYMLRGKQVVFNDPWFLQDGREYEPEVMDDIYNLRER